jgi:predicted CoA-binding protein
MNVNDYANRDEIERILRTLRVWAVVGASSNPARASNDVASFLLERGYEVIPVNPAEDEILGQRAYPDLAAAAQAATAAGRPIEVVDIFRRADQAGVHVDEAISVGARAVWMQLGVVDEAAADRARSAGLMVVMDRCPKVELPRVLSAEIGES